LREINRTSNAPLGLLSAGSLPPPKLFPRSTLIHTSDSFKIFVKQTPFKRQTKFDSSDRLYGINVQILDGQEGPFASDCQDVLQAVLEYVVGQIQDKFDNNKHRQMYITISDVKNMLNGINTANYSIRENKDVIIKEALKQFFMFLQSHKEMRLSDSFTIHVKVLGIEHVHHRMTKLNNLRLHLPSEDSPEHPQNVPNGAAEKKFRPDPNSIQRWKFVSPRGFSEHKFAFSMKCLLFAAILGAWRHRSIKFNSNGFDSLPDNCNWHIMKEIHNEKEPNKMRKAGKLMMTEMTTVCKSTQLCINGPYTIIQSLPKLAHYYAVNYVVYSERVPNNGIAFQYPNPTDLTKPTVLLFQEFPDERNPLVDHVSLIINRFTFQTRKSFECFICHKKISTNRPQHVCTKLVSSNQ